MCMNISMVMFVSGRTPVTSRRVCTAVGFCGPFKMTGCLETTLPKGSGISSVSKYDEHQEPSHEGYAKQAWR